MVIDYKNHQVYIQVVKHKSITKAADFLGISKSTVSRILAQIESEWGAPLINRSTRSVSTTDAGNAVYLHFINIIEDAKRTKKTVESSIEAASGEIRLTSAEIFASQFLSPIIKKFSAKYPEVKFEVVISSDYEHLIEQGFDLAFRVGELEDSTLKFRHICQTELGLFASKEYLKNKLNTLSEHNCLIYTGMPLHDQWLRALGNKDYSKVIGNITSNSESFLIEMARQGQGILLFPRLLLRNYLENNELEQVMSTYSNPINISAVYPYTNNLPNRLRLFLEFVVEELR